MSVDTELREPAQTDSPYLLYCGRIDPNKGCLDMFDYFIRYKKDFPSELQLILAGKDDIPVPEHPDIEFRGFVSDEEKFRLMAGANLFLMPSPNESFSIVTMEAMAQRSPVLANGSSDVLTDHIKQSGAGRIYSDYRSFSRALNLMLSNRAELSMMGDRGREYAVSKYTKDSVRKALLEAVEEVSAACGSER
jgi:glycosyltransferase involved in cell wall biosynthesis